MGVISGIGGAVNGESTVREWSIESNEDLQEYIASNTAAGTGRIIGNEDWSGSYSGYGWEPAIFPGDTFTFTGSVDGTNGVTGSAMCESVDIELDIEGGAIMQYVVNFAGNGALTLGAAAASDSTDPSVRSTITHATVELETALGSPESWDSPIADVRRITINIAMNNPSYASSSTAGVMKRVRGSIDATVNVSLYTDDPSTLPAKGTPAKIRIRTKDDTVDEHWEIWFVRVQDVNVETPIEDAGLVAAELVFALSASETVDSVVTAGKIVGPSTTTHWPFA